MRRPEHIMKGISWRLSKWSRRATVSVCREIYVNRSPRVENSILLAGSGRSGTTWLAQILSEQLRSRIIFEPFNPPLVPEYSEFNYFQYMKPSASNWALERYVTNVFEGTIRNAWVDRLVTRISDQSRIVKTIRANLMLAWLRERYPVVPQLLIIRHPCAVVASRIRQGWATDDDLEPMLAQPDLIEDHLQDRMEVIRTASTLEEKHAAVWCIHHLVPLRQFAPGELTIVFYEDIASRALEELERISGRLGLPVHRNRTRSIRRPSGTSSPLSAIRTGDDVISAWQKHLSPAQVERILGIVDRFNLGFLYGDSTIPLRSPDSADIFSAL